VEGVEREACVDLFRRWAEREDRRTY